MNRTTTVLTVATSGILLAASAGVATAANTNCPNQQNTNKTQQQVKQQNSQQHKKQQHKNKQRQQNRTKQHTNQTPATTSLTEEQTLTLQHMLEEEKLAGDVYETLAAKYNSVTFSRIAFSEDRHQAALQRLAARYNVEDPTENMVAGQFKTETTQTLYNTLINQSTTYTQALQTGVQIEKLDIKDLQTALQNTQTPDTARTYQNLLKGSEHHLRAFTQQQ